MAAQTKIEHLFQILGREETMKRVLKGTEKLRTFIKVSKEIELSPKGQLLKELCISMGRQGAIWARICGILLDEDLSIKNNDETFPYVKWAAVIPTEQSGHRYNVGEICFIVMPNNPGNRDDTNVKAICLNGLMIGDALPMYMRSIKIPSNEEVIKSVNQIFDDLVSKGLSDEGFSEEVMKEFKA